MLSRVLIFSLGLGLGLGLSLSPAWAGSVTAVYYNAEGEISMIVIPDQDGDLDKVENAAAFAPSGQIRVVLPSSEAQAVSELSDLKIISLNYLDMKEPKQIELAGKIEAKLEAEQALAQAVLSEAKDLKAGQAEANQ